ncbi:hypothetical protein [Microbacterium sp.]|uniref:hypothetical protein n=1 Tax=Microbacterium sp. TaxID=51671 RepID=UPI0025F133F0|nr:hypothetical protein [Microbacterium sp.]
MAERQRIERVPGRRRAKLTPAPGTTAEPTPADETAHAAASDPGGPAAASGPNDERMRRDVPPHY